MKKPKYDIRHTKYLIRYISLLIGFTIIGFGILYLFRTQNTAAWYSDNWARRKTLTIDADQVSGSSNLENFPVLVSLTSDPNLSSNAQADGDDILFTDKTGSKLDHEIESYASGTLVAWVRIPSLSPTQDTDIYMYYGNSNVASQQSVNNVWQDYQSAWHLKETATDEGTGTTYTDSTNGGINGTQAGPASATGKIHVGQDFDGTDDRIDLTDTDRHSFGNSTTDSPFSISAWVNMTDATQFVIASKTPSTNYAGAEYLFYTNAFNQLGLTLYDGSSSDYIGGRTATIVAHEGSWIHLVATYDGSGLKSGIQIYINGQAQSMTEIDNGNYEAMENSANPLRIGSAIHGSAILKIFANGIIDEVKIDNIAKSADWIATEYANQNSPSTFYSTSSQQTRTQGPIAYWNFDEGYGTTASDNSGNDNSGTISAATWRTSESCITNNCLEFDGSTSYINLGDDADFDFEDSQDFTITFWMKTNSLSVIQLPISKKTGNVAGAIGYQINLGTNGKFNFYAADGTDQYWRGINSTLTTNTWYHVTFVYDEDNATNSIFYINGQPDIGSTSGTITDVNSLSNSQDFRIGSESDNQFHFNGFLDEVKIYPYTRTADQIKTDYISRGSTRGSSLQFGDDDLGRQLSQFLIAYWPMDEKTANTCTGGTNDTCDKSGNNVDGFWNGTATTGTGKYGAGVNLDGNSDYIQFNSPNLPTTDFTYSAWVNLDTVNDETIFHSADSAGGNEFSISVVGTGEIEVSIDDIDSPAASTQSITANTWNHLLVTRSSDLVQIYINGVLDDTTGTNAAAMNFSTCPLRIGVDIDIGNCDSGLTNYTAGDIDEVRIYNRALTPDEVQALYRYAPGPIAYYDFESNVFDTTIVTSQVSASSDDAEEQSDGTTNIADSDLELVFDVTNQIVGLRFNNINIPQGETINTATIQFTVDETGSGGTSLTIHAEDADNASTFTATTDNISNRTTTTASVDWDDIDAWNTIGQTAGSQRTINIAPVIQEIIDRPGWTPNNSIVIIISGTGERVAEAYDGVPASAPLLSINYGGSGNHTIKDKSGNGYQATPYNFTSTDITPGKYGSGLTFNGTDTHLAITNTTALDFGVGDYTVGMWIKTSESCSGNKVYFGRYTTTEGYWLGCNATGNVANLFSRDSNDISAQATGTTAINDGVWHYLTGVKNGNNIQIYVDGILENTASASFTGTLNFSPSPAAYIGGNYATGQGYFANILMDELRIYDYARTPEQIAKDMNAGHPAIGTPVGSTTFHYSLDEGYGTVANDKSPQGINGTITGATWTNSAKFGKALSFDGNDYINTTYAPNLGTASMSISLWFKVNSLTPSDVNSLFGAIADTGSQDEFIALQFDSATCSSGQIRFTTRDTDSTTGNSLCSTNTFNDGNWHHAVAVFDHQNALSLYVDKVLENSTSVTAESNGSLNFTGYPFAIGARNTRSTIEKYFNGTIDEVKVYPFALTSDQVNTEYNFGKQTVLGSTGTNSSGVSDNSTSRAYCIPGDTTTCNPPVLEHNFESRSGTTYYDTSGNGNNGTASGGPTQKASAYCQVGKCLEFDGNDDWVNAGSGSTVDDIFDGGGSVSVWIKPYTLGEGSAAQIYNKNRNILNISTQSGNNVKLTFTQYFATLLNTWQSTSHVISVNQWNHIQVVYDNGSPSNTPLMYINSTQVPVTGTFLAGSGTRQSDAAHSIYIGNSDIGSATFDGLIDQLRVYNYTRTPAQIAWDYNQGGPVAHYKFDECSGTTANDTSLHANHGTINIGTGGSNTSPGTCSSGTTTQSWHNATTSKWGSGIDFDGTDDYISVLDDPSIRNDKGQASFSWWLKLENLPVDNTGIIEKFNASDTQDGYYIWTDGINGTVTMGVADDNIFPSGGNHNSAENWLVADNQWHHYTITWRGTNPGTTTNGIKFYRDGQLFSQTDSTALIMETSTGPIYIGKSDVTDIHLDGQLDDVRIYNYALTAEQVKLIHNNGAINFQ